MLEEGVRGQTRNRSKADEKEEKRDWEFGKLETADYRLEAEVKVLEADGPAAADYTLSALSMHSAFSDAS